MPTTTRMSFAGRPRFVAWRSVPWRRSLLALAPVIVGLVVGLLVPWTVDHQRAALLAALAILIPLPLVVRGIQRKFDPFEPIQIFAAGLAVLFVARPLAELHYGIATYAGYFIRPGFNGALLIGLVGTAALYLGYALPQGRRFAERLRPATAAWDTRRSVRFAVRLVVVGLFLTAMFAAASGGPRAFFQLYSGRSGALDANLLRNSTGWLYLGPYLTIPASLILYEARSRQPTPGITLLLAATVLVALAVTVPRGDRTYVLPIVFSLIALRYIRRGRRPKLLGLVLALVLAIVAINVLLSQRNIATRTDPVTAAGNAVTTPGHQLKDFITGPDPSLFSVLALEYAAVPKAVHYSPGATPISILAGPVPGKLWGHKPQPGLVHVTKYLFFEQARVVRASNGPSMLGDFYADWGFVTVAFYCLLIGLGVRTLYEHFLLNERSTAAQLVFAGSLPLMVILLRNNLTDTIARSLALFVPILLCAWVCSRPAGALLKGPRRGTWSARAVRPARR